MTGSWLDRAYLAWELDALFPDEAPTTVVPWVRAAPLGRCTEDERAAVGKVVASAPYTQQFVDVDPRLLFASQPGLVRAGVAFYLDPEYRRSGRTFADWYVPANKYPIVHVRGSDLVVLSGHHRAAAALLLGEPLRARLAGPERVEGPTEGTAVTPSLFLGATVPQIAHERCEDRWIAEMWINLGATAWLPSATRHDVRHLGYELAVEQAWMHHQLHYARTGHIRLPRGDNDRDVR